MLSDESALNRSDAGGLCPAGKRRARGLTLIELLVTVAIVAGMILGFSVILSSASDLVATTQARMRANRSARAVADVIREDFSRLNKDGFLAVRDEDGNTDNGPAVTFTTVGFTSSMAPVGHGRAGGVTNASAAVVTYGVCRNPNSNGNRGVLFRRAVLLVGPHGSSGRLPADCIRRDLGQYQGLAWRWRDNPDRLLDAIDEDFLDSTPAELPVPPGPHLTEVRRLWQVLTPGVKELRVWSSDGMDADGNLEWSRIHERVWGQKVHGPGLGTADWPALLRLRFRIVDESMPDAIAGQDAPPYELVVPIGR